MLFFFPYSLSFFEGDENDKDCNSWRTGKMKEKKRETGVKGTKLDVKFIVERYTLYKVDKPFRMHFHSVLRFH